MSIFLDVKNIGFGPGHLNMDEIVFRGNEAHQDATFRDNSRNFYHGSEMKIYNGSSRIITMKGVIVHSIIHAILDGSSDIHLTALRDVIDEEIGIRTERTSPDKSGVSGGTSRK